MRGSTAMGSENRSSEDDGDAGNRGEVASGERHGAGNATIEPTVVAPFTGRRRLDNMSFVPPACLLP